MKGYTTNETLPDDVRALYELTAPLEGGPVFDLPAIRQYAIDFSKLTLHQADVLIKRKWKGIRLKVNVAEVNENEESQNPVQPPKPKKREE